MVIANQPTKGKIMDKITTSDSEAVPTEGKNDNVVKHFRDINEEPDKGVVAELENALAMAKSGQIRSITIAASLIGHATYTAYATKDLQEAIGLVGFLHHTLCATQREASID